MARFHQAVQEAAAHLAGDPVSLATWAHTVRRCDQLLAGTDPAMRSAAALTPVLTTGDAGLRRQGLILALDGDPGLPVSAGDRQELRVVALYVTRAASREADPSQRLLLAGIERRLLGGSPARGSFEASLRGWSHAVAEASEAMDPVAALAVSRIQRTLLDAGVEAMNRLEVADGVGHERLLAAVETSRDAWARAYDAWLEIVPRKALYIEGLDRATVGVQLAARDASDIDKLRGLLATGFGGNLAAAMAVTPADMRVDSDLVARAVTLEQRSDLAAAIQPREFREPEPVAVPVEPSVGPAVRFTTSSEAASSPRPAVLRQGLEVETVNFGERGRLEELAGERDAGVIAGAARAGVVEAVALVGGATVAELVRLVERGERAQAAIAASALPIVYSWSRRFAPEFRQEFVSRASLQLAEVASKWDPRVAGWSTFAYTVVDYAYRGEARRLGTSREVTSEDVGRWAGESPSRSTVTVQRSPEAEALWGAERDQVARLLDQLPDRMRVVMEGRLGLAGSVKTFAALAEETGVSPWIVSRDARVGTRLLREHHLAAKATEENPSPDSAPVTLRHLAQVLQPTKEDRSRTSTSARPEHRSGRPSRDVRGVSR